MTAGQQDVADTRGKSGQMIRVVIADDQRVTRDGLALLVGLNEGMQVVALAGNGEEAVAAALLHRPDVVLMDLSMPVMDGIAATAALAEQLPGTPVLVLSTYADDASIFPALRAGAKGYLTKDVGSERIEAGIRAVHAGQTWMDPVVQQRLVAAVMVTGPTGPSGPTSPAAPTGPVAAADGLTDREREVLVLIAEGLSNAEIAERLYLGLATVKTHINRIFAKTGARDRAQAVRYAYRSGIVPAEGGEAVG
ncbi:DNA-binding NarL/FixJ family response regulator [Kitasatospora sp. MAP12-15]|uniref:response regulator transcription factor n=1 Tax=unclassified Kitasatospora TaxID=2633591 RepID=UPI002474912E|nr:response regulator transcription factor [Kitasatospora sp. MAP12-44]MDH6111283.1 DNA-binding NarL/FixJ family response regulator [Kitasatospora sp. MAP12-44]